MEGHFDPLEDGASILRSLLTGNVYSTRCRSGSCRAGIAESDRDPLGAGLMARLPGTVRGRIPGLKIVAVDALTMFAELGPEVGNVFVG